MRGTQATIAVALAVGCIFAAGGPAAGEAPPRTAGRAATHAVAQGPAAVLAYWTPARMRGAETLDLVSPARPGPPTAPDGAAPTFVPPAVAGASGAPPRLRRGGPARVAAASAFSPGDERVFPNRVHGRVFFSFPGEGDFACSGTAVNSPGRSLVITAGHCVHSFGEWATNWIFVPGYRDGNAPYGEWPATVLRSTPGWTSSENVSFDIGAATVRRNADGRALQDVVGARGIGFDQARDQVYQSYGYPAQPPFDGERLLACRSRWQGDDTSTDPPRTMSINCDMNGGSSGGGWVAGGLVLSVNSYCPGVIIICLGTATLYGPYFGDAAHDLYQRSRGRPVRCSGAVVTQLGGSGRDSLAGSRGRDSIGLAGGPDSGAGRAGDDRLCGGSGDDRLRGGRGFDVCDGGLGTDVATGCEVRRRIP